MSDKEKVEAEKNVQETTSDTTQDNTPEIKFDTAKICAFLKKNYVWIILGVILFCGLYVRLYHVDYPVVGFHNWKETHYLTEARNYAKHGFFYEGFLVPHWDYYLGDEYAASGAHGDSLPSVSIVVGLLFKIFGPSLFVARLVNILFVLGAIFFAYLCVRKLFGRKDLALMTAAFMALTPLLVFFGRQMQLINPGLFFGMFGLYYYFRWIEKPNWKTLVLFSIGITLCVITKYPNALIGIPMAAIFPWKRVFSPSQLKKFWKHILGFFAIFSAIPLWAWYSASYSARLKTFDVGEQAKLIDFSVLSDPIFWRTMESFVRDNWTMNGLYVAAAGALALLVLFTILHYKHIKHYLKNRKAETKVERVPPLALKGTRFMLAYALGGLVWFIVMSFKLKGHHYHQYPLAFLFAFLLALVSVLAAEIVGKGMYSLARLLAQMKKQHATWLENSVKIVLLLVIIFLFLGHAQVSWARLFNSQFPGLDVAGEFINENSLPGDRMFHSSHQSYGVLWHADRKGHRMTSNVTLFKEREAADNVQWVFMYQWGLKYLDNKEIMDYISENYGLAQIGIQPTPQGNQPFYLLFKKGGTFNMSNINELTKSKQPRTKEYELIGGVRQMAYINLI